MDKFDKELYDFLIQEKHFEYVYDLYELFPDVRDKLIEEFWRSVEDRLQELTEHTIWGVKFWEGSFSSYWKFGLYVKNSDTEDIRIIYEKLHEQPYYGLWLNMKSEELDRKRIINFVRNIEDLQQRGGYDGKYWIGKVETDDNFHNIRSLKKILPNSRKEVVKEYSQLLYDFAEELSEEVLKMSEMK